MKIKKIICLSLALVLLFSLSSCGKSSQKRYETKEYILETEYKEDYKILQLSDTHIANKDNRKLQYDFLNLVIKDANPDFIVVTGDLFTFADKAVAKEYCKFLDSYNVPWTVSFGNHDEQCYFSVDWLTNYLNNYGSNCMFKDLQDDDVFGNCNFAINLKENGTIKHQIIILDSNRYNYGEYIGYDYLKEDQVAWYERLVKYTTEANNKETVPSTAFFHIPLYEYTEAMEKALKNDPEAILEYGDNKESCSTPEINSGMFDKMLELGSTKAICVGHDHVNNSRILYKGIYFSYGITSTDRIYYDEERLGGQVITIHSDNSYSFTPIYHSYEEVK